VWFNDYHAFIPIIFSRIYFGRSTLIIAGFDGMGLKIAGKPYGLFSQNWFRRSIGKLNYKLCHRIASYHSSLIHGFNEYGQNKMGFQNWCRINQNKIHIIPPGYNSELWKSETLIRDIDFLTVGIVNTKAGFLRKGLDSYLKMAELMPKYKFLAIGINMERGEISEIPKNVEIISVVDQDIIRYYMNRSKVYCQFSLAEGLPNTVMESILMGCFPCLTAVNGMTDLPVNKVLIRDEVRPKYLEDAAKLSTESACYENRKILEKEYSLEKRFNSFNMLMKR
jgi:hypothetical protein